MNALSTVIGVLVRRLNRHFGIGRRYGVRFANGSKERTGFTRLADAEVYGQNSGYAYVVFEIARVLDMRLETRPERAIGRDHYTGDSEAPVAARGRS